MVNARVAWIAVALIAACAALAGPCFSQSEDATVSGRITDQTGAVVAGVSVQLQSADRGTTQQTITNGSGIYVFSAIHPGVYHITVRKEGFRQVDYVGLTANVQAHIEQNFKLQVGAFSESITVTADTGAVNTTDASVSTVVDQKFVANMPLNGRSFQNLLTLSPGVIQVPGGFVGSSGEISVNGQRAEANSFSVDGVSANTGTSTTVNLATEGFSGSTPGETVLGTTQSLVSIDALQEFRTTTSTYSAEYGRTPGGQFSFSTRSGTNLWHGSLFDFLRNDAMDANNWFNKCGCLGLPLIPRQAERQNDFGGTLGGPVVIPGIYNGQDKTFFFFSYEGLRLLVPQRLEKFPVPDAAIRQLVPAPLQPFLNAFPIPNGGEDGFNDGLAFYNLGYSAPSSLDAFGIRVDHSIGNKVRIFGRYADTPSSGWSYAFPAFKSTEQINIRSVTAGITALVNPRQANELRINFTQNHANFLGESTNYGGAVPFNIGSLLGPDGRPLSLPNAEVAFFISYGPLGGPNFSIEQGRKDKFQYNLTDTYSWSYHTHQLKFGVDWRRLTTSVVPISTGVVGDFFSEASLLNNSADFAANLPAAVLPIEPVYHNFSAFAQDEWKTSRRLSLSMGLRWDVNPAPGNLKGPPPYTVDQITNLATAKLAPAGTPLWRTDWRGFAPRLGLAYQVHQSQSHEIVVRTGIGIFYDTGNINGSQGFVEGVGFASQVSYSGVPFPLTPAQLVLPPPDIAPPYSAQVVAFDPHLRLPYTLQWNVALEQSLGKEQGLTMTYVGSSGQRLLTTFQSFPNFLGNTNFAPFVALNITQNRANSNYNSLQVKYQRRLSHGFQALASYTWSHSIDDATSNFQLFELVRGSSDFDVRHNFQAAVTYDVPGHYSNRFAASTLQGWGLDTRISARSALPVDILGSFTIDPVTQQLLTYHANVVPGQPVYVYGSQYPGGRNINYNAFVPAPPGVDGNAGRNSARGFDAVQADVALQREFPIHDRLHLQFRAEAFNVLNHPAFAGIYNNVSFGPSFFGYASATLNQSLGGLNSLYQTGGPRSLQMMLRIQF